MFNVLLLACALAYVAVGNVIPAKPLSEICDKYECPKSEDIKAEDVQFGVRKLFRLLYY